MKWLSDSIFFRCLGLISILTVAGITVASCNSPSSLSNEEVARQVLAEKPMAVGFSAYVWNMDLVAEAAQLVPFHISTLAKLGGFPPIAKAAVPVPVPANSLRAVFKSATSVQLVPSHDSVNPVYPGDGR